MQTNRGRLDHHDLTNFEHLDVFSLLAKAWSLQPLGHDQGVVVRSDKEFAPRPNRAQRGALTASVLWLRAGFIAAMTCAVALQALVTGEARPIYAVAWLI